MWPCSGTVAPGPVTLDGILVNTRRIVVDLGARDGAGLEARLREFLGVLAVVLADADDVARRPRDRRLERHRGKRNAVALRREPAPQRIVAGDEVEHVARRRE